VRHLGTYPSMDAAYHRLVNQTRACGIPMTPRGLTCRELRPACFTIEDARRALYTGFSRRLNYKFLAVEALAYLCGWGDRRHAELLIATNSNIGAWVNTDTKMFDGAYGPRFIRSIPNIISLLQKDPDSRQAVASIWQPGTPAPSLDIPCTLSLQFYRGHDSPDGFKRLCMTATMRSNDLNWGTPYDVAAFAAIQCVVAACLGWEPGAYTHVAGSMHVYDDATVYVDKDQFKLLPSSQEKWNDYAVLPSVSLLEPRMDWDNFYHTCADLLLSAHHHRVDLSRPLSNFAWDVPTWGVGYEDYWGDWLDLVRWSWKEHLEPKAQKQEPYYSVHLMHPGELPSVDVTNA
jgi:hypothetical protein